jgi:hypothetical protein
MEVEVVVTVHVDFEPKYRHAEARFEEEIVAAVRDCLSRERTITVTDVALLGEQHCLWLLEMGMPVACDLVPGGVDIFRDGGWRVPSGVAKERICGGFDLLSLADYIQRMKAGA